LFEGLGGRAAPATPAVVLGCTAVWKLTEFRIEVTEEARSQMPWRSSRLLTAPERT
jgi:hypothetical protein